MARHKWLHLQNANFSPSSNDPDFELFGFRNMSGGARVGQPFNWERSARASISLYETEGLGERLIDAPIEALENAGVILETDDKVVRELWSEFWEDEVNGFKNIFWRLYTDYKVTGEMLLPIMANEFDGSVQFGFIDPFSVGKVIRRKTNPTIVERVEVAMGVGAPVMMETIKPDFFGMLQGDVFYFRNTKHPNSERGFPVVHTIADLVELHGDNTFNEAERVQIANRWIMHMTRKGDTPEQLEEYKKTHYPDGMAPPKGTIEITNEDVDMKFLIPELKGMDRSQHSKMIMKAIFAGSGYPGFMFGEVENLNISTAREQFRPLIWRTAKEARIAINILTMIFTFIVQQARLRNRATNAGIMSFTSDSIEFKIKMGNIYPKEVLVSTAALKDLTVVLSSATVERWLAPVTAKNLFVEFLNDMGAEIDVAENDKQLKEIEKQDQLEKEKMNQLMGMAGNDDEVPENGNGFQRADLLRMSAGMDITNLYESFRKAIASRVIDD